jgi:hypothetical protein
MLSFLFENVIPFHSPERAAAFDAFEAAVTAIETAAATADDPKLLDLSLRLFDNEVAGRAGTYARAATMMSTITLAATLVTGGGFSALRDTGGLSRSTVWAMFLTIVVVLLYLTATILLLFRVQNGVSWGTPDPSDLPNPPAAGLSADQSRIAAKLLRCTVFNYRVNNRATNDLRVAQKYFRNGLLVLVAGGVLTTALMIRANPGPPSALRLAQMLARTAGCNDLPSLKIDRTGRWLGTCLRSGRIAGVIVNTDGWTEFPP